MGEKDRESPLREWRIHAALVLGLALCGAAFWFELGRAERGNALSWAYVFEWPLLAIFAVYMWWKLRHGEQGGRAPRRSEPGLAPEYASMLKAWQDVQRERSTPPATDEESSAS